MRDPAPPAGDSGPSLVLCGLCSLLLVQGLGSAATHLGDGLVTQFFARYVLASLVGCAAVVVVHRNRWTPYVGTIRGPRWRDLLVGAGSYAVCLPGVLGVHRWNQEQVLDGENPVQSSLSSFHGLIAEGAFPLVAAMTLVLVVVVPLLEELIFRGFLYGGMRESIARTVGEPGASSIAVGLSTAAFVSVHPTFTWLPIAVLGLILGLLRATTRSLWTCIVFHGVHNLVTLYYPADA